MSRRLATGFELANVSGLPTTGVTRSAARCGFYGWAYRRGQNTKVLEFDGLEGGSPGPGAARRLIWNWAIQLHLRVRRLPTAEAELMSVVSNQFGAPTGVWTIDGSGIISLYSVGSVGWAGRQLVAQSSVAVTAERWYRYHFGYLHGNPAPGGPGTLPPPCGVELGLSLWDDELNTRLWGEFLNSFDDGIATTGLGSTSLGFSTIQFQLGSTGQISADNNDLEVDFDDIVADDFEDSIAEVDCNTHYFGPGIPAQALFQQNFTSFEQQSGCMYPLESFSLGTVANWGTVTSINQFLPRVAGFDQSTEDPVSVTPSALLTLTALAPVIQGGPALIGTPLAITVGIWNNAGSAPIVLGVQNLQASILNTMSSYRQVTFPQPAVATAGLTDLTPIVYGVQKDADATQMRVALLSLELNTPSTIYAPATVFGTELFGIVVATDTYVGDGLSQYVYLGWTPDWVGIWRADAVADEGLLWHDGMIFPKGQSKRYNWASEFYPAPGGFVVRKTTQSVANNVGVTYRYVAIRDGQQFGLFRGNFAFDPNELTVRTVEPLDPFRVFPTFVPDMAWATIDTPQADGSNGGYVRGPGHTGANSSPVSGGAAVTNAIVSLPSDMRMTVAEALKSRSLGVAWTAWATNGFAILKLWDVVTYTGDGNPTQVVPVDVDGGTPVLVYVFPGTGTTVSYVKTPDDTGGTNARAITGGGISATAITAVGADSVTVGATLNVLGTVYNMLAIRSGFDLAQQTLSVTGSGGLVVSGSDVETQQGSGDAGWGGGGTGLGICGDGVGAYAPWGQTTPR